MGALIPLLFALILVNHRKLKENTHYRFSVFSIVGITFFTALKYINYLFSVLSYSETIQLFVNGAIVSSAVLLCLSPIIVNSGTIRSSLSVIFFSLSVFLTFGFDREIKNFLIGETDYFGEKPFSIKNKFIGETKEYISEEGGYSFLISKNWELKKQGGNLDYLIMEISDIENVEIRPKCFHKTGNVITEVVDNFKKSDVIEGNLTERKCYRNKKNYMCLIKRIGDKVGAEERWHWVSMNPENQQNIELDILIKIKNLKIYNELYSIIDSVKIGSLPNPTPICGNTLEWF